MAKQPKFFRRRKAGYKEDAADRTPPQHKPGKTKGTGKPNSQGPSRSVTPPAPKIKEKPSEALPPLTEEEKKKAFKGEGEYRTRRPANPTEEERAPTTEAKRNTQKWSEFRDQHKGGAGDEIKKLFKRRRESGDASGTYSQGAAPRVGGPAGDRTSPPASGEASKKTVKQAYGKTKKQGGSSQAKAARKREKIGAEHVGMTIRKKKR